jgi:hypothetical protein
MVEEKGARLRQVFCEGVPWLAGIFGLPCPVP